MKTLITLPVLLALSLVLSGCSTMGASHNGKLHSDTSIGESSLAFSESDIMFAQMMIPHHQQAVEMSILAETRAVSSEVKALAATIKAGQEPEIEEMRSWLSAAGAPEEMGHAGHMMGMDGMLSKEDMAQLELAEGTAFDILFIEGMIAHHKGAIQMVDMIADSKNSTVKALGIEIVKTQTEEMLELEAILSQLQG